MLAFAVGACIGDDNGGIGPGPMGPDSAFSIVGQGRIIDRFTSDLWVHGDVAYTGTWGIRNEPGNMLYVWDVIVPQQPVLVDSVTVDAGTVNDVKIRADGVIGVITHENSSDGLNGITLLDLSDPLSPTVITRFTTSLEPGVHNVWIDGDYVYAAVDAADPSAGLRVIDITDPQNPDTVASFYGGSSFLHDVYVRDGLAFLSHWDAGLIILDVGNGVAGGAPDNPVEVGRVVTAGGQVHNAWYWPDGHWVFVGEEDFQTPGVMHAVDVTDLANPTEVATFAVSGVTPHNFWVDETRAVLYVGWYEAGIRAIDVSGNLTGALNLAGRELGQLLYDGTGNCASGVGTCAWAPQLHNGLIYASDLNSGLWVLQPEF
jgi:hypothetical protein